MLLLPRIFLVALLAGQHVAAAYLPIAARHDEAPAASDNVITVTHAITVTSYVAPTKSTKTLTRTSTAFIYAAPSSSAQDAINGGLNPINGMPVPPPMKSPSPSPKTKSPSPSPKSTKSMCGPSNYRYECPNATASPSMFKTQPLTTMTESIPALPTTSKEPGIVITPLTKTIIGGKETYVPVPLKN